MAGYSDAVFGRHIFGCRMPSRTGLFLTRSSLSYRESGTSSAAKVSKTILDSKPDPKAVLVELQRLKAQNERLRQQLAERERNLNLRESQAPIDSPVEDTEQASPSQDILGELLQPTVLVIPHLQPLLCPSMNLQVVLCNC